MKYFLLVLSLTVLKINLNAQAFTFNQGGFTDLDYLIELPYEHVRGKIIIEVKIGSDLRKFILDTGAPTSIRKGLFEQLGLEVLSSEDITDINGNKSVMQIAKINELKLSESSAIDIPAVVFEENLLTRCFGVDGLIGSNLFRNSILQFDSKNKIIRISNDLNKLDISNANISEIFIDQQSSPIFKIQIGDRTKEMLLFDTGADELYTMSNTNMSKFKKTKTFSIVSESMGSNSFGFNGMGQESKNYMLMIPKLSIQGLTLKNVISETTEGGNSRIGARLLEYGLLAIDYKNSKSYFEPFSQPDGQLEEFWNLSPTFIDGKLVVGRIWSKEFTQVSVGDEILSVNDIDMSLISDCEFLLKSPLANSSVATLKIRNKKGEIQTLEIQKK